MGTNRQGFQLWTQPQSNRHTHVFTINQAALSFHWLSLKTFGHAVSHHCYSLAKYRDRWRNKQTEGKNMKMLKEVQTSLILGTSFETAELSWGSNACAWECVCLDSISGGLQQRKDSNRRPITTCHHHTVAGHTDRSSELQAWKHNNQ